jgi:hypothetical protein
MRRILIVDIGAAIPSALTPVRSPRQPTVRGEIRQKAGWVRALTETLLAPTVAFIGVDAYTIARARNPSWKFRKNK